MKSNFPLTDELSVISRYLTNDRDIINLHSVNKLAYRSYVEDISGIKKPIDKKLKDRRLKIKYAREYYNDEIARIERDLKHCHYYHSYPLNIDSEHYPVLYFFHFLNSRCEVDIPLGPCRYLLKKFNNNINFLGYCDNTHDEYSDNYYRPNQYAFDSTRDLTSFYSTISGYLDNRDVYEIIYKLIINNKEFSHEQKVCCMKIYFHLCLMKDTKSLYYDTVKIILQCFPTKNNRLSHIENGNLGDVYALKIKKWILGSMKRGMLSFSYLICNEQYKNIVCKFL